MFELNFRILFKWIKTERGLSIQTSLPPKITKPISLEYIKKNEIYTIKKITKLDNGEAYDVSTTADKLNKLWGEIAKVTGVGRPYLPLTYMASIEDFMVTTNSSSRIESISFKDSGKKRDIKIQYKISDVSIGVPSAAKELTLVATNKEDLND